MPLPENLTRRLVTKRPALEDGGKLTGVSLGSASRTLTDPTQVKSATREAVRQAVAQLGYVSNGAARALASRKPCTIHAVFPTMYNQSVVEFLHTLQQTLFWRYAESECNHFPLRQCANDHQSPRVKAMLQGRTKTGSNV